MNEGSSAPYLACTPCVPLFSTLLNRGGNRRAIGLPGEGGIISAHGGTFARSSSVLIYKSKFPQKLSRQYDDECCSCLRATNNSGMKLARKTLLVTNFLRSYPDTPRLF